MQGDAKAQTAARANCLIRHGEGESFAKCILSGEHFVVYGQPALVMGLDKKIIIQAVIELEEDNKNTGLDQNIKKISGIRYQIERLVAGEIKSLETGVLGDFIGEAVSDSARTPLIYHALINALQTYAKQNIKQITLTINSHIPQNRGYGSSACVLTALIKALNNALDLDLNLEEIFTWVHKMECYQHGKSSGVDPLIAILGGVLFVRPTNPPSLKNATRLDIDIKNNKILNSLKFIDTGESVSSTGECVSHVNNIIIKNNINLSAAGEITNKIRESLESQDEKKFNNFIRENQLLLEEIEVIPEKVKTIIENLAKKGLVAKITGSGSIRGDAAGMIFFIA